MYNIDSVYVAVCIYKFCTVKNDAARWGTSKYKINTWILSLSIKASTIIF